MAATTSDKIHFFKLDNRNGFTQIGEHSFAPINASHDKSVCGVRFWNENPNMITIGEENGNIATYDLRAPNKIVNFENDGQNRLTCFDLNVNDKILCAGCQQNNIGGVPILFYDIRMSKMQHSYVDSHQDDVTTVKFHPVQSNSIATGSTDGLINIFDINEREEDDAMTSCLNTESSVQSITWHPKSGTEFYLTCITHTNDLHLFDTETEDLVIRRDRNEITEAIKRKLVGDCYLIDCYTDSVEEIFILAGSNYNNGECLRSLTLKDKILNRRNNFIENKQIVRCSSFNPKVNYHLVLFGFLLYQIILFTGQRSDHGW